MILAFFFGIEPCAELDEDVDVPALSLNEPTMFSWRHSV
jgi:hypothetical protein